jgi:hypothetical protein
MNERIQKLYIQVVGDDKLNFDSYLAEKFAELIVRECAEYAEQELDMAGYKKKFMLKHFGVEEK